MGASDEVLGSIESGVDFEKRIRILSIYQQCRTPEEIERAFQVWREELEESIKARMAETRRMLLENFDADVHERLRVRLNDTQYHLDRFGKMFWELTRVMLKEYVRVDDRD